MLTSVSVPGAPSGKEPIVGIFTAPGQVSEVFSPVSGRPFSAAAWGPQTAGGINGSISLQRSFDGGSNWTIAARDMAHNTLNYEFYIGTSIDFVNYESGVVFRLFCNFVRNGVGINYRISQ
ncbi:hypothetical protein [Xanthobacter autotrophicus]|uniref:hypothetical protein n=1 Tax=Xanthobacter autotrophicus TaxID=280 RepID=UPI00372CE1A4